MSLSIGIVGLPNVGKSTLFNALTKKSVPAENYPFCTIDPSVGIVPVPDSRLDQLADFSKSAKKIPAVVEFIDIAGLVKGASKGEGLGNKFLANIREADAVLEVVRIFEDENIIHVHGEVDPLGDIGVINYELILADTETVGKRLGNLDRDVKRGDKKAKFEYEMLTKVSKTLETGNLASSLSLNDEEKEVLKGLNLLSNKKFLYLLNKKAGARNLDEIKDKRWEDLMTFFKEQDASFVIVDAGTEFEMNELSFLDKQKFRTDVGIDDGGIDQLIVKSYEILELITYFTTGEDETRAWTIKINSTAPIAGTAIHTDFKDKFIRAEVIEWDKLLGAGSFASAREKGLLRTEGKEYIVKDGDVVEFRI